MPSPNETEVLTRLTGEIRAATLLLDESDCMSEALPTAAELARKLNYRLDTVKKKLKVLKDEGLIQSVGMTPKRYRFNAWALRSLPPEHLLYTLLADTDGSEGEEPEPYEVW